MPIKDILQIGKKLKHPQIRQWIHPRRGDDYYRALRATKEKLAVLAELPKSRVGSYVIAYQGYEYRPKEFLRRFPKFRLKKPKTLKQLSKQIKKRRSKRKKRRRA